METQNPLVSDILKALLGWAPLELAEDWDNAGLTVGDPYQSVKKIACALDPSIASIEFAHDIEADLLLTHHPLPLRPMSSITDSTPEGRRILSLISYNISLISLHTNLDRAISGVTDGLVRILGLNNINYDNNNGEDHGGHSRDRMPSFLRVGELPSPTTFNELLLFIKSRLQLDGLTYAGRLTNRVKRVAVCGGSGGGLWHEAKKIGADCLVTGEVRHHDALDALEADMLMVGAGHFETERHIVYNMVDFLQKEAANKGWDISILVFEGEHSPLTIFN